MKRNSPLSIIPPDALRCAYSSSHGHRCRMPAVPDSRFCLSHARLAQLDASDLATELTSVAGSLESPEEVHGLLAKVALAVVAGRMSARKAAVLGYLGQMLLRSHREIAFQKKLDGEIAEAAEEKALQEDREFCWRRSLANAGSQKYAAYRDPDLSPDTAAAPAPVAPLQPEPRTAEGSQTLTPVSAEQQRVDPAPSASLTSSPSQNSSSSPISPAATDSASSGTSSSSTSFTSSTSSTPSSPKPPDLNHFYPRDPTLAPGLQDPNRLTFSPPDRAVLARRNLRFNRTHGYRK